MTMVWVKNNAGRHLVHLAVLLALLAGLIASVIGMAQPARAAWIRKTPPLSTPWTSLVSPTNALPEYPRPQMVRSNWVNLNGEWQFANATAGQAPPFGVTLAESILVPFPVESALSGIMRKQSRMWYRRTFTVPSTWSGQRVLLQFGAVDWEATVYVNRVNVGTHRGGYDAFTFDITPQLIAGGTNEVIVNVYDPTDADGLNQPMGKQRNAPGGIMYTSASGIWQTVWLEPVPTASISRLDMTPNIDNNTLSVIVRGTAGQVATVTALLPGTTTVVGSASGNVGATIVVPVPNARRWSPSDPYLYDLRVTLNGGDAVTSYFGMRKISLGVVNGKLRPLLNNQFLFQLGTLDQGYWPDGIYTAPTDAALRFDLEKQKELGYNAVRKHIKIEPQRWFYHADRLGLLVWQDMVTMPNPPTAAQQTVHTNEYREIVDEHRSSPSIIMWVNHNEGWGQYNQAGLATTVKSWDPSRLVNNMSGINCCGAVDGGNGDVADWHCYLGPCSPVPSSTRIAAMGEYGGLGLKVAGHEWNAAASHSYVLEANSTNLVNHYVSINSQAEGLVNNPGLSAAIYTEPYDVETEVNGWYAYDRFFKLSATQATQIRNSNLALINAVNTTYTDIVPTSETTAQSWRYTTAAPPSGWNATSFNDTGWALGSGGFGTAGTPGAVVRTTWNTTDLWLRRTFNPGALTATQRANLSFRLHHDEDAELYINGVLAATMTGYVGNYVYVPISTAAQNAVVASGNNVLAIHVRQTTGGQYIDAGISIKTTTGTPPPTPTPVGPTPTRTSTPVPNGNLALNKPATADSSCAATEGPEKAFNGSWTGGNTDKWCSVGATKWLRVDLGASYNITSFTLYHAGAGGETASWNTRDFNIQTSTDDVNWTTVVNVTANTANTTTHPIAARTARYVRLNVVTPASDGNTAARIYDLQVFGSTSTPPTPTRTATSAPGCTTNQALNRPATSSSNESTAFTPNLAVDGNTTTRWASAFSDPQWIQVDLGVTRSICRVRLNWEAAFGRSYTIQTSNDAVTWSTIYTTTTGDGGIDDLTVSGSGRYVRMNGTVRGTTYGYSLWELEVFGS